MTNNDLQHNKEYFESSKNIETLEDYTNFVENRMGMSTKEFQHRLENSLPERIEQAKVSQNLLHEWLENDIRNLTNNNKCG